MGWRGGTGKEGGDRSADEPDGAGWFGSVRFGSNRLGWVLLREIWLLSRALFCVFFPVFETGETGETGVRRSFGARSLSAVNASTLFAAHGFVMAKRAGWLGR